MARHSITDRHPGAHFGKSHDTAEADPGFSNWFFHQFLPLLLMLILASWLTLTIGHWIDQKKTSQSTLKVTEVKKR